MGRILKSRCNRQFRPTPYPLPLNRYASEKRDWEQAICSVCLEAPHNAVLLLCSSHDKGCRPYMCGTGFRHSNCLDQFKKAYAKASAATPEPQDPTLSIKKSLPTEVSCPLCRGEVKGWTVVEPARQYLNKKKRSCVHDGCSFIGTFKQLRKHVKSDHRCTKPRKVDPALKEKWRALEMQREHQDVMSTIRSSMPRSVVLGDYVIDMDSGTDSDDFDDEDDHDEFDDDVGGERGFLQGRRGRISRRILYYLFREGARLARAHRENTTHEDGGNGGRGGVGVGHQSEEGDGRNDSDSDSERITNRFRTSRRRVSRRQGGGRGRSASRVS